VRQHERFLQSNIPSADLVFYAAARAVPAAAAFFGTIIYARILGAREYALYSMSVNIVMAVSALGFAWLNQGQLRFNSKYEQRRRAAYEGAVSRGSVYASVIVALLAPLGYAVSFSDAHEAGWFLCVIGAATAFYGLHMFNLTRRQAELRPKLYVANEVRRAILSLVVPGMILYVWGCGHRQMLVGLCLALSPAFFEYLHYVRRRFGSDNWGSIGQEMWAFGWPMAMWATLLMSVPFVERFLVLRLIGIDALSRYVPLYDLVYRSFTLFLMPITLAYHPRIMEGYNRNDTLGLRAARRYLVSALLLQLAIGGVVIIPATIWGSAVTEMLRLPGGMHDRSVTLLAACSHSPCGGRSCLPAEARDLCRYICQPVGGCVLLRTLSVEDPSDATNAYERESARS
jgi:O-antigen/teichoic acid export membrane protein